VETWHQRMRKRLGEKGWNLADLARHGDLPYTSLRQYSRGKVDQPRPDILRKMAAALDVSEQWLLFGTNETLSHAPIPYLPLSSIKPGEDVHMSLVQAPTGVPEGSRATAADASMAPDALPSDLLFYSNQLPEPGNIVVVWVEAEQRAFLRTYTVPSSKGGVREYEFAPRNPSHTSFKFTGDDGFTILGVVTHRLQSL